MQLSFKVAQPVFLHMYTISASLIVSDESVK